MTVNRSRRSPSYAAWLSQLWRRRESNPRNIPAASRADVAPLFSTTQAPAVTGRFASPHLEVHPAPPRVLLCRARSRRPLGGSFGDFAALLRAPSHARPLAQRPGVARARFDRHAGVVLESVRVLPVPLRLLLPRLGFVRDTTGSAVPHCVAGTARDDLARSGAVAARLRGAAVQDAAGGARSAERELSPRRLLVLSGAA